MTALTLCTKLEIYTLEKAAHVVYSIFINGIGGVMTCVIASSVVDRGYQPRLVQMKEYLLHLD